MNFKDRYMASRRTGGAPFQAVDTDKNTIYDFVILGAGSAGSIVAARLAAACPDYKIAIVDAGCDVLPGNETVWDPTQWALVSHDPQLEWGYRSVPQAELDNRVIDMGRARGLGGCALHNAMVYVRGGSKGYDNWAANLHVPGWSYEENVPYFDQVESRMHISIAEHDAFTRDLVKAGKNNGLVYNPNYNEDLNEACVSPFQFCISKDGRRETSYSTFLHMNYPNLTVFTGWTIERLVMNGRTVHGVSLGRQGTHQTFDLFAKKEVVLSAGAVGSPQILMLSGVGPSDELRGHGIDVALDMPAVGENFQDDLFVTAAWRSKKSMPNQPYGLMGSVIFANSSNNNHHLLGTDIECSLAAGTMAGMGLPPEEQQSYWIYPNLQLLKSRGTVKLASKNPYEAPLIDPNYLGDLEDMQNCIDGLELALAIGADAAMADWMGEEILPATPKSDFEDYIRKTAGTCYHYAGTCRMGNDAGTVVAPDLRVHGLHYRRIGDPAARFWEQCSRNHDDCGTW